MYELLCDIDNLYESFIKIRAASMWKEETQRYELYLVPNLMNLRDRLANFTYTPTQPRGFFINERGKPRYIESRNVDDRIVQNIAHEQIILPAILPKLIYDNAASLDNRGTSFFRHRLEYHLTDFSCHYGNEGFALVGDLRKFFDNIWHSVFIDMLTPLIPDERVMDLIKILVYSNKIDVSYMSDEEYANCMYVPFDNLSYRLAVKDGIIKCTGEKFMYKGMGLGSQISQDAGIFVPHVIDNYIKIVCGIPWYGRYMDDFYILHQSKDYLKNLLNNITQIAFSVGLFINEDKTHIINLKHEFSILQTRYQVFPNHSIAIMPNNDTFIRETIKLKKQRKILVEGNTALTYDEVEQSYKAWLGNILKNTDGNYVDPLKRMNDRYNCLFHDYIEEKKKSKGGNKNGNRKNEKNRSGKR